MNSFWTGFEKQAGIFQRIADKAKGFLTDQQYLYHGTSHPRAKKILNQGILPDVKGGISFYNTANKGLAFATKDKDVAAGYAKAQEARDKAGRVVAAAKLLQKKYKAFIPEKVDTILNSVLNRKWRGSAKGAISAALVANPFGNKGHVHRIAVPKPIFKEVSKPSPRIQEAVDRGKATESQSRKDGRGELMSKAVGKLLEKTLSNAYKHDVVFPGGIPKRYISS